MALQLRPIKTRSMSPQWRKISAVIRSSMFLWLTPIMFGDFWISPYDTNSRQRLRYQELFDVSRGSPRVTRLHRRRCSSNTAIEFSTDFFNLTQTFCHDSRPLTMIYFPLLFSFMLRPESYSPSISYIRPGTKPFFHMIYIRYWSMHQKETLEIRTM